MPDAPSLASETLIRKKFSHLWINPRKRRCGQNGFWIYEKSPLRSARTDKSEQVAKAPLISFRAILGLRLQPNALIHLQLRFSERIRAVSEFVEGSVCPILATFLFLRKGWNAQTWAEQQQ
jgi:hypothetical protein